MRMMTYKRPGIVQAIRSAPVPARLWAPVRQLRRMLINHYRNQTIDDRIFKLTHNAAPERPWAQLSDEERRRQLHRIICERQAVARMERLKRS